MDLNKPVEFNPATPSSPSPPQPKVQKLKPITSLLIPYHPGPREGDDEETRLVRFKQIQSKNLNLFWHQQFVDIYTTTEFKNNHSLPLARIKRIMKSDEEVKLISADTPVLLSKACELFVLELTLRSWLQTEEHRRRTLQCCDIARAVRLHDVLDFLEELTPLNHHQSRNRDPRRGRQEYEAHPPPPPPMNQLSHPPLDINEEYVMSPQVSDQFEPQLPHMAIMHLLPSEKSPIGSNE